MSKNYFMFYFISHLFWLVYLHFPRGSIEISDGQKNGMISMCIYHDSEYVGGAVQVKINHTVLQ